MGLYCKIKYLILPLRYYFEESGYLYPAHQKKSTSTPGRQPRGCLPLLKEDLTPPPSVARASGVNPSPRKGRHNQYYSMRQKIDEVSAQKVRETLNRYFKSQGIGYKDITERLGYKNIQVVYNMLGHNHFGKRTALRWAKEFGFNTEFLLTGRGKLLVRQSGYRKIIQENEELRTIVLMQKKVIEELKSKLDKQ